MTNDRWRLDAGTLVGPRRSEDEEVPPLLGRDEVAQGRAAHDDPPSPHRELRRQVEEHGVAVRCPCELGRRVEGVAVARRPVLLSLLCPRRQSVSEGLPPLPGHPWPPFAVADEAR